MEEKTTETTSEKKIPLGDELDEATPHTAEASGAGKPRAPLTLTRSHYD
eukprot:gene15043-4483_t